MSRPLYNTRTISEPNLTVSQAGGVAGTSVDLLFYPLDTVKTRLQSSQGFFKAGGFRGIYKGVGSVVIGSAPGGESLFFKMKFVTWFSYFT